MNLYHWFWYHTEFWLKPEKRRQYTYLLRDFYHESPILFIFTEAWVIWLVNFLFHVNWWVWIFITLGVILGHLFWGKNWIPDEGEKSYKK